jgi:serine/threonine-protein kinase HipA
MRKAKILFKNEEAGILTQNDDASFIFRYHDQWWADKSKPMISLTLPKNQQEFHANFLFPCFFNMLPEGGNKEYLCKSYQIDDEDYFGLLMIAAKYDSIGAITVIKIED